MFRQIKFRAWDGQRMLFMGGKYHVSICGDSWGFWDGGDPVIGTEVSDDPVLMQFTGLQDKNGQDIYEGDIYRTPYGVGVIKYHKCTFVVTDPASDLTSVNGLYNTVDCTPEAVRSFTCEVIGNIYEHPELLDTKAETA